MAAANGYFLKMWATLSHKDNLGATMEVYLLGNFEAAATKL